MAALQFRSFLNTDPPLLAGLWSRQPPMPGREPYLSPALWELEVFSKPYFDRDGLILALRDDSPVGFVHAGFAPEHGAERLGLFRRRDQHVGRARRGGRARRSGTGGGGRTVLARQGRGDHHRGSGSRRGALLRGACSGIANGVSDLDLMQSEAFTLAGFQRASSGCLWRCDIRQFRPPVNREMLAIKRGFEVAWQDDAMASTWWQACQYATHSFSRYQLREKRTRQVVAEAAFCDLAPLMTSWAARTLSLVAVSLDPQASPEAAGFLVGEALRRSSTAGFAALLACSSLGPDLVDAVASLLRFELVAPCSSFTKSPS